MLRETYRRRDAVGLSRPCCCGMVTGRECRKLRHRQDRGPPRQCRFQWVRGSYVRMPENHHLLVEDARRKASSWPIRAGLRTRLPRRSGSLSLGLSVDCLSALALKHTFRRGHSGPCSDKPRLATRSRRSRRRRLFRFSATIPLAILGAIFGDQGFAGLIRFPSTY